MTGDLVCGGALGLPWLSESLTVKDALCRRVPSAWPKPGAMHPYGLATDQWEQMLGTGLASPGLALPRLCHPLDIFLCGDSQTLCPDLCLAHIPHLGLCFSSSSMSSLRAVGQVPQTFTDSTLGQALC